METILVELSKTSPLLVTDVYNIILEFSKNIISILSGSNGVSLFNLLTILFSGFSTYMDTYGVGEGNYLRKQLQHQQLKLIFQHKTQSTSMGPGIHQHHNHHYNHHHHHHHFNHHNRSPQHTSIDSLQILHQYPIIEKLNLKMSTYGLDQKN